MTVSGNIRYLVAGDVVRSSVHRSPDTFRGHFESLSNVGGTGVEHGCLMKGDALVSMPTCCIHLRCITRIPPSSVHFSSNLVPCAFGQHQIWNYSSTAASARDPSQRDTRFHLYVGPPNFRRSYEWLLGVSRDKKPRVPPNEGTGSEKPGRSSIVRCASD